MMGRYIRSLFFLPLLLAIVGLPGNARCESKPKTGIEKDQPIQITSDRMDAYNEKRMVVFSGRAVATQGARTIRAERLTLYYRDDPKRTLRSTEGGGEGAGSLEKVEARGNVTITEGERTVTGEEALFEQDPQKITMTGSAVLREGDNVIRGDKIVVFLNENRGVVESAESRRVTATIYPGETKKR